METFKEIFKYLFAIALMLGVLGITAIILYSINIGYGPFLQDMNNDGVTTYKDFFVRVLSPAGYVLLGVLNPILDSDLGKFFEASTIEETNKALAWSGLFFYAIVVTTFMSLVMKFLIYLFNLEDALD
ncbi:hypothetical protein [Candidatus Pseudothioglobus sp. Uisw_016]|uniref:hypothetical protein n=1 Tax=Candidatus Pseudothioglobus sp. Uisw_016 TaxID=3230995 RepID=UPI003A86A641